MLNRTYHARLASGPGSPKKAHKTGICEVIKEGAPDDRSLDKLFRIIEQHGG